METNSNHNIVVGTPVENTGWSPGTKLCVVVVGGIVGAGIFTTAILMGIMYGSSSPQPKGPHYYNYDSGYGISNCNLSVRPYPPTTGESMVCDFGHLPSGRITKYIKSDATTYESYSSFGSTYLSMIDFMNNLHTSDPSGVDVVCTYNTPGHYNVFAYLCNGSYTNKTCEVIYANYQTIFTGINYPFDYVYDDASSRLISRDHNTITFGNNADNVPPNFLAPSDHTYSKSLMGALIEVMINESVC